MKKGMKGKHMNRFTNRVAVVTGGSSGIGLATVSLFLREGGTAIIADMVPPKGETGAEYIRTDVTSPDSLSAMVDQVVSEYGHIDILVANAGISEKKNPISQLDEDNWQKVIDIDLTGVVLTDKYVVRQMEKQGHGSVINMSSILGVVGGPDSAAYSAAKAGVANVTRSQSINYASKGIRFNSVAPGYVNTPLLQTLPQSVRDSMIDKMPIGRLAEPEEIAQVIAFLASDESSIVTGALINADGGYTAQ